VSKPALGKAAAAAKRIAPGLVKVEITLPRGLPQTAASQVLLRTNLHGDNILGAQGTEVTPSLMPTTPPADCCSTCSTPRSGQPRGSRPA
jgi:hypothetical protein